VLVLDRKAAAGEEICCTGIVSRECLDEFGIDQSLVLRQAGSARLIMPSGKWLRFWRDDEVACILDRSALDLALANQAQEVGAEYSFDTRVSDIKHEDGGVRVRASCRGEDISFDARTAVLATGFGSPLPGRLGLGGVRDIIFGAQAKVRVNGVDEVEVYFSRTLAPGGFAWLVPTSGGGGLAGLLTHSHPELRLNILLSDLQAQGKIESTDVEKGFATVPRCSLPRTSTDRILVVGEAAGQVKPTTSGGIYYGLLCADMAADSLHQAFTDGDFSRAGLCAYDRQWRARLGWELRIGNWLCSIYGRLSHQRIEQLCRFGGASDVTHFIAGLESLPFDRHSALALKLLKYLAGRTSVRAARALWRLVKPELYPTESK
jgi:digeranylgeranylglycerophospholipid reductase